MRRCCSSRTRWGRTNQGLPHNLLRLKLNFACSASPLSPTCRKLPDPLLHHKVADLRHLHGAVEPTAASPTFESCRSTALPRRHHRAALQSRNEEVQKTCDHISFSTFNSGFMRGGARTIREHRGSQNSPNDPNWSQSGAIVNHFWFNHLPFFPATWPYRSGALKRLAAAVQARPCHHKIKHLQPPKTAIWFQLDPKP